LLTQRNLDELGELAGRERRVLGLLTSLTFDRDPLVGWRAVEAMGVAAERTAQYDPGHVQEHLRRLRWMLNDESGGVCWRAPEAMAEVVRARPDLFADYIPIIVLLLRTLADEDLEHFRAGVLWAIGRLGSLAQNRVPMVLPQVAAALEHRDPQVRGMAVWCLGQIGKEQALADKPALRSDDGPVDLYEEGSLRRTQVRRLL